jgi:hypothetical protein
VNSIICPKAEKLNIKSRKTHLYNITNIQCINLKKQVVHSATELNKRCAQWPKLHFKTKREGFGVLTESYTKEVTVLTFLLNFT